MYYLGACDHLCCSGHQIIWFLKNQLLLILDQYQLETNTSHNNQEWLTSIKIRKNLIYFFSLSIELIILGTLSRCIALTSWQNYLATLCGKFMSDSFSYDKTLIHSYMVNRRRTMSSICLLSILKRIFLKKKDNCLFPRATTSFFYKGFFLIFLLELEAPSSQFIRHSVNCPCLC